MLRTEAPACERPRFTSRLPGAPGFDAATRSIQIALDELRATESALERQLNDLRAYMRRDADARRRS